MPHVPVVVEFDYQNSGTVTVPAGETIEHEFYPPEGWVLTSWGITSKSPELNVNTSSITPGIDDIPRFIAIINNTDTVNGHPLRFTYVLMKL